ncbi:MAG: xanthine dehydrogenase family protein molybdopterin-binding subunit [Actinomycetota bacterium]|nr:xanthine dehydrogenase family protein molybdopterin-binding subunit [Actinomycetota bacterium]
MPSILGTSVLRREDRGFLTDGATYTADLDDSRLDGAVHATYVRSTMAHADVTVDATGAFSMPGVVAVFTAEDLDGPTVLPGVVPVFAEPILNRPLLAGDRVRFVGEPVAVVLTEHPSQGEDAAEAVFVDYDPRPAVVDPEEAATDAAVVFEDVGTNVSVDFAAFGMATGHSDDAFFSDCDFVVSGRVAQPRTASAPLEVRSAACTWEDGRIILWISNQNPHGVRDALAGLYGEAAPEGIRVLVADVGGGFGAKIAPYPEEALLPWLSMKVGRPVRWFENRTENMNAVGPGRGHIHHFMLGGTSAGDLTHYRLDVLVDGGAYARIGAFLPMFTLPMTVGVYDIPNVETAARSVVTNTTPLEAYRGAGRPEATLTIERAVDMFATEAGLDPVEVRRRNYLPADAFPVTTSVGTEYDTGEYEASLDLALGAAGIDILRAEQQRRREAGEVRQLGIGVATYVEMTAGPAPGGEEYGRVEITPEGKARVLSGSLSHGQSHRTTFSMIVADRLGISPDDVELVQGDTDEVEYGGGTFASKSTQLGGSAVHDAAGAVVDEARRVAAELLEAGVDDVVLDTDTGLFHVAGSPSVTRTWADVAASADDGVLAAESKERRGCTYPFGTHVAVVEVDVETGYVRLDRHVTCDDAGVIVNPMIVEGQRHGGIAQGVAQALLEEVSYDADGNPQTTNFADYGIVSMAELPSFELVPLETPTPCNPLGAKGIGESGAIGSTPAVQNAVVDALSHLGVDHLDIPLTPQKVWAAIDTATSRGADRN